MKVTDPTTARLADRLLATNLGVPDLDGTPPMGPDLLTVVIPVRDRPAQLHRALAQLRGLRCFVVDDGSHEPRQVRETARRHGAEYVRLDVNLGPAAARNIGLAKTDTPCIAFVDSDVQVTADSLLRLTRHFSDPRVALVAPKVVGSPPPGRERWFHGYEADHSSLTLGDVPAVVRPGAAVAWVPSACMVGRVNALGDGFDPTLRVGEDVDLVWQLVAAGHRVRYDPSIQVSHDARSHLTSWLGRKAFYGTGSALLGTRHGSAVAPAVLTPTYAAAAAALLARHPAAVLLVGFALFAGTRRVHDCLPPVPGRTRTSVAIAAKGLGWAARQETALLLRHWWPAALAAAMGSRTARGAVLTALSIDTISFVVGRPALGARQLAQALVARRLDDLAYGAGLWVGAIRHRTLRVLLPVRPARITAAPIGKRAGQHDPVRCRAQSASATPPSSTPAGHRQAPTAST